jgi:hypothetical protein
MSQSLSLHHVFNRIDSNSYFTAGGLNFSGRVIQRRFQRREYAAFQPSRVANDPVAIAVLTDDKAVPGWVGHICSGRCYRCLQALP